MTDGETVEGISAALDQGEGISTSLDHRLRSITGLRSISAALDHRLLDQRNFARQYWGG